MFSSATKVSKGMIMNCRPAARAAQKRWRACAILLLPAICVGGVIFIAGCGKGKAEQCKALIDAVERADSVRGAPDFSVRDVRNKYYEAPGVSSI